MIRFATVPDALKQRLPRYPIPSILLARLATDVTVRGVLLVDAGRRASGSSNANA